MTLAEAQRAAGVAMTTNQGEACTSLSASDAPLAVSFVSTAGDGRVDVIAVGRTTVRTEAGIGPGSTVAEVRQAYPGVEERVTGGDPWLVHQPDDPMLGGYQLVFAVDDGRVAHVWAGRAGFATPNEVCG